MAGTTLIIGDSLRYDVIGFHGVRDDTCTPNIDALAKKSNVFSRCYSLSPCTIVSTSYLLMGTTDVQYEAAVYSILPDSKYLQRIQTKALLTAMEPVKKWATKFDVYVDTPNFWHPERMSQKYRNLLNAMPDIDFVYIHSVVPHHPYREVNHEPLKKLQEEGGGVAHEQVENTGIFNKYLPSIIDMYKDGVKLFDDFVGIIHEIDKTRHIIITADHGECFGEGNWFGHNKSHEVTLHIPLIIWSPTNLMGHIIAERVDNTQIIRTVVELLFCEQIESGLCKYFPPQPTNPNTIKRLKELGYIS